MISQSGLLFQLPTEQPLLILLSIFTSSQGSLVFFLHFIVLILVLFLILRLQFRPHLACDRYAITLGQIGIFLSYNGELVSVEAGIGGCRLLYLYSLSIVFFCFRVSFVFV
jgi:hypothetical protein